MQIETAIVKVVICRFINNQQLRGALYTDRVTLTVQGCFFSGNVASWDYNDINSFHSTITITSCPAGYTTTQGSALDDNVAGTHYSYSCAKCSPGEGEELTTRSER